MRDIQEVLSRWGAWSRESPQGSYSPIAAGFKGLLPQQKGSASCCDDDGLIIDGAVGHLMRVRRPEELDLILRHYLYGQSKRCIARALKCSEGEVRRQMSVAESFIDGCLCMLGVPLEMDIHVKKTLVRDAKSVVVC